MPAPLNLLKQRLCKGERMVGLWTAMCDPYAAEVAARAGFDWLVVDGEHAPNDIRSLAAQMQVIQPLCPAILRLPMNEPWLIKQALDAGAQTLLAPMINTAEEARAVVRAMRYPPDGIRGVAHPLGRCSHFGEIADYGTTAQDQLCLIVQVESCASVANLEDILAVDGVDAALIGPADLAADMGHHGDMFHADVQKVLADTLRRIRAAGKAAGIFEAREAAIQRHFHDGAQFVGVGADIVMFSRLLRETAAKWKGRIG